MSDFKLFGYKFNIALVIACIILGYVIGTFTVCSCSRITVKEGMQLLSGAPIGYKMGKGVSGSWDSNPKGMATTEDMYKKLEGNSAPSPVEMLKEGKLDIFGENKFSPTCCANSGTGYSNSSGCLCTSSEQVQYLNSRGGNRTYASEY